MLSLLNGTFTYDKNLKRFRNDHLVELHNRPNGKLYKITDYMNFGNDQPVIHEKRQECSLCGYFTKTSYIIRDKIILHSQCANIIDHMINNKPIQFVLTTYGEHIHKIPIFGFARHYIFTSNGINISQFRAVSLLRITAYHENLNIYDFIHQIGNTKSNIKKNTCTCCRNFNDESFSVCAYNYCIKCYLLLIDFKCNLVTKYMILKEVIITDIVNIILCIFINAYHIIYDELI